MTNPNLATTKTNKSSKKFMASTDAFWWQLGYNSYTYLCTFSFNFSCENEKTEKEEYSHRTGGLAKYIDEKQVNKKIELCLNSSDWDNVEVVYEAWKKHFDEHGARHKGKMFFYDKDDFEDMAHLFFHFLKYFKWSEHIKINRTIPTYSQEMLDAQARDRESRRQEQIRQDQIRREEEREPRYSERVLYEDHEDWMRDRTRY